MAVIFGTPYDDIFFGTVGVADTAVVSATQNTSTFSWDGTSWNVLSTAGPDQLISIETVQLTDATFQLTGAGSFNLGSSTSSVYGQAGSVARLGDGSFIHTSSPYSAITGTNEVVAQRISSTGELLGSAITVNTTTAGAQYDSDITVLSTGDYVVSWTGPDSQSSGIYMQRFSAAGAALGGEVRVNTTTAYAETNSQITALTGGRYLVTWVSDGADGSGSGIYGQIFTSAGNASGGEFRVNTTATGDQRNVSIAALSDGGFVATYGSADTLKFQRFSSSGLATGTEKDLGPINDFSHASTTLTGDKIVIATVDPGYYNYVVTLDASGTQTLVSKAAFGNPADFPYAPAIATLSDGGYVIAWYNRSGQNGYDLQLQRFDSAGLLVGSVQTIAYGDISFNYGIEIAPDTSGGYAVQYRDYYANAYSARFDGDNLLVLPSITGDETSNIIAVDPFSVSGVRLNGLQGNDRLTGTDNNDILDGGEGNDRLTGGGGNDTYIVTQPDRIFENFGGGIDTVIVRENYVLTAREVENIEARGTAAINLTGNALDNTIIGNKADNLINGRGGGDTMIGGGGNDTYFVDSFNGDKVIERVGEGIDTVVTSVSYQLATNVENLRATGKGLINLSGNTGDNLIVGNNAANYIDGIAGADILEGKGGSDTYIVNDARVQIIERAGPAGGSDTVYSSVSFVLDDNIENLYLGPDGAINGTGNDLANTIVGSTNDNIIDGGAGADAMYGGDGGDIYIVDNALDLVVEDPGNFGTDEVRTSVSYSLANDAYAVENLTLTGTANINGTGNGLANVIRGNVGPNILDGGSTSYSTNPDKLYGYSGDDTLISQTGLNDLFGGNGNDTYKVYHGDDRITELSSQGTDTVRVLAPIDFQLSENVENLILESLGAGNDLDTRASGNNLNNQITGNTGSNLIDGSGGADTMTGGLGDDTYVVDSTADSVVEVADQGDDTILSAVTYTTSANVENLHLIGANAVNATGNALDNVLYGNNAINSLFGLDGNDVLSGGDGNDILQGGNGNDIIIGGTGNDSIDGGADIDTVSYRRAGANIKVDLNLLVAQVTGAGTDRIVGVENVDGSATGSDALTGDGAANVLKGLGGIDTLSGGGGNDVLMGGEDSDTLSGGAGDDRIDGGNGLDIVTFEQVAANITVDLSQLGAQNTGDGLDTIRNIESVVGSVTGNDTLTGDYFYNQLLGLGGNDTLTGGDGADYMDGGDGIDTVSYARALDGVMVDLSRSTATDDFDAQDVLINFENIVGGAYDDTLSGSIGANVISGEGGRDVMRGGGGADTFLYRSAADSFGSTTRDLILDWATGDKIDLALIDANSVAAGDQAFTFIGTASFSNVAGQLRQVAGAGQVFIEGDIDGNGISDFSIAIKGSYAFAAADFVL